MSDYSLAAPSHPLATLSESEYDSVMREMAEPHVFSRNPAGEICLNGVRAVETTERAADSPKGSWAIAEMPNGAWLLWENVRGNETWNEFRSKNTALDFIGVY